MRKTRINWKIVASNIQEVREELNRLAQLLENAEERNETELQVSLQHAYHHMNFAWNIRHKRTREYATLSHRNFKAWGRFPEDIWFE
jgi:hypothetical protein